MCVRARVVTPLHEDERWMIQALAFLSPVPWLLAPAPSREGMTRRWALSLFASPRHHLQSKMPCREKSAKKVTFHDVTVGTTAVEVDEQPVRTDHFQTDEKRTRHSPKFLAETLRYPEFRACRFRFTSSERKANICRLNRGTLVLTHQWLNTRESRNGHRGSSIKNGKPFPNS